MPLPSGNMRVWYDADDLATITKDGSNKVSAWNDKSGNGYNLGQGTAASQPVWTNSYLGGAGKPAIVFDGSNDWMQGNSARFNNNAQTVLCVINPRRVQSASAVEVICGNKIAGNNPGFGVLCGNGFTHTLYNFIDSEYWDGFTLLQGTDFWQNQQVRADYRLIQYDTAVIISQFPAHTDPANGFWVGTLNGGLYWGNVGIGEVAVWDKTLSASELLQVDDYIRSKYLIGKALIKQVPGSSSDAEENVSTTAVDITSAGLQMHYNSTTKQLIGVRFSSVSVPKGAQIAKAYLRFIARVDATGASPSLTIKGQASDDAAVFAASNTNISARSTTTASVSWSGIESWYTSREFLSADVASIVQELVDRSGWVDGNAMAFIISGTTDAANPVRDAYTYDGSAANAAYLFIEYKQYPPVRHWHDYRRRRITP